MYNLQYVCKNLSDCLFIKKPKYVIRYKYVFGFHINVNSILTFFLNWFSVYSIIIIIENNKCHLFVFIILAF